MMKVLMFIASIGSVFSAVSQRPTVDTTFRVAVESPMFLDQNGPKVLIDEAHNNLHRKEGGLYSLTRMMEADGADVYANFKEFDDELLGQFDLIIIVNPLHDSNVNNWQNPCPSAFTSNEISALERHVKNGGNLLLVADHMPIGGAVQELAARFDVRWSNSFAMQNGNKWPPSTFQRSDSTLLNSPVTVSSEYGKRVAKIGSFTGSAFQVPEHAKPFLAFNNSHRILFPDEAWKFSRKTKNETALGWFQGACLEYGDGKIVFLAEAAMITAQLNKKTAIGMNSPDARENPQLVLNIFRYLVRD